MFVFDKEVSVPTLLHTLFEEIKLSLGKIITSFEEDSCKYFCNTDMFSCTHELLHKTVSSVFSFALES